MLQTPKSYQQHSYQECAVATYWYMIEISNDRTPEIQGSRETEVQSKYTNSPKDPRTKNSGVFIFVQGKMKEVNNFQLKVKEDQQYLTAEQLRRLIDDKVSRAVSYRQALKKQEGKHKIAQ